MDERRFFRRTGRVFRRIGQFLVRYLERLGDAYREDNTISPSRRPEEVNLHPTVEKLE